MTALEPAIDEGLLAELRQQLGDEVVQSLVDEFMAGNGPILAALYAADTAAADRMEAAHSMKGSCASIGLAGTAGLCRAVEQAFREQRLDEAERLLATLRPTLEADLALVTARLGG